MHYRASRLYASMDLTHCSTPRCRAVDRSIWAHWELSFLARPTLALAGRIAEGLAMVLAAVFYAGLIALAAWRPEPGPNGHLSPGAIVRTF